MNISAPFVHRPIGTSLLALGVFVAGVIAYFQLGVAPLPNLELPMIFVQASEPGADAGTMASTVASPLERHLGQIAGVDEMNSRSSEGSAFVMLQLDAGRDLDGAARDVQAAINASAPDLPSGLKTAPVYRKANPNNSPVLILALTSKTHSLAELYDLADALLAQRIRQQSGVSDVDVAGGATPAVRVDLNLRALASMGLSADQVRNALVAANVTSPQGFLSDGKTTMAVAANDSLHTAADFANLVVAVRNAVPVHLRDVATIADGQEDRYQAAWFNGQRAILMFVRKQSDANVIGVVNAINAQLPEMRTWLPGDVELTPFSDRTVTIRASVDEVQISLLISLAMVVLTMLLFLRRLVPTVIAALAVPLSLAGAFITMYALGYTLDNLSLMALVISIGFVVDDAIVVIENVVRHMDAGMSRLEATLVGAKEIGFTIVSITVSLLAVFSPLLFMGGFFGLLFREFAVTLSAAIAISAIVSLTLTTSLCGRFLRPHREEDSTTRFAKRLDAFHAGMLNTYRRSLDWALRHPRLMAVQPLLLVVLSVLLIIIVPKGFFPQQDTGQLQGSTESSPDVSYQVMSTLQQQLADLVAKDPAVDSVGSRLGGGRGGGGNSGQLYINLKTLGDGRNESTFAVMNRLQNSAGRIPGIALHLRPVQDLGGPGGRGGNSQYTYSLKGDDIGQLRIWGQKLVNALKTAPEFKDVNLDSSNGGLRENFVIDRDAASRLGVTIGAIDSALYDAFGQRQVSTIYSDINQYKVVVSTLPNQAAGAEALGRLYVRSNSGSIVPITAVAHIESGTAPTQIEHVGQSPVINMSFNLAPDVPMSDAVAIINRTIVSLRMPGDIRGDFAGDFRRFAQSQSNQGVLILAAIFAVYIVLGILYESLIHPITILSTLPSAGVGALLAMLVTGTELSIVSVIAIVLLIGIVKKNAIMMVDFALHAERERQLPPFEAIREACLVRFRPIMMTSMVAIFGAVPLAIGFGAGSEMRRPLGIAMIGGLLVSQALTLLTTPAIYLLFARQSERRRARRAEKRARLQQQRPSEPAPAT